MNNKELIIDFIITNDRKVCGDCLSEELQIKPRQQVNQICRKDFNKIKRKKYACDICKKDKLVNYISEEI